MKISLVAEEGLKRYVTTEIRTDGPYTVCLYDEMNEIEELLKNLQKTKKKGSDLIVMERYVSCFMMILEIR